MGWITHFYMLTHKLPNWDDISQLNGLGLTTQIGRWMLEPLQDIGQRTSNPAIHGMLLIVFISLAACFVVAALEFKTVTSAILTSAIMVTFPSITGILFFMFTAHLYAIGVCLFCASAYLIRKFKYGFIPAGICIVLALAIYQPFVSVAISVMILSLISETLSGKTFKGLVINGVKDAGTLIVSTFIYIQIAHLVYPGMANESYGGAGNMGKIAIVDMPRNFARVYKRVLEYFITRPFSFAGEGMRTINICVVALVAILLVLCIVRLKLWKRKLELAFLILMLALFPFSIGFVYFMAPEAPFSMLMLYAYSMLYVLVLLLTESAFEKGNARISIVGSVAVTAVLLLSVYNNYLLDSQAYFRSGIAYERASNYYERIITRVESKPGYKVGDKVAVLGEFYYVDNPSPIEEPIFDEDALRELSGVALENGLITSGVRSNFMRIYLGFDCGNVSDSEKKDIMSKQEYKDMGIYPDEAGIAKIDDVWVVKMCE